MFWWVYFKAGRQKEQIWQILIHRDKEYASWFKIAQMAACTLQTFHKFPSLAHSKPCLTVSWRLLGTQLHFGQCQGGSVCINSTEIGYTYMFLIALQYTLIILCFSYHRSVSWHWPCLLFSGSEIAFPSLTAKVGGLFLFENCFICWLKLNYTVCGHLHSKFSTLMR